MADNYNYHKYKYHKKFTHKTLERKEFIEQNYLYSHTPMDLEVMAYKLGISYYTLKSFMVRHKLIKTTLMRLEDARYYIKEGILDDKQISDIVKVGPNKIKKLREEMKDV